MPFKSQAQRRFMFAKHPKMAEEFAAATPKNAPLPEHVAKKMADGGEVQNPDMGASIDPNFNPNDSSIRNEQGLETPPEVLAALAAIIGMPGGQRAVAEAGDALGGGSTDTLAARLAKSNLDQTSWERQMANQPGFKLDFSNTARNAGRGMPGNLGQNAPEMEGVAGQVGESWSDIRPFIKGQMGKGTPNEMTIWGVKGNPESIAKLGYGPNPGSIPESVLKAKGILPNVMQTAPQGYMYAHGGEVKPMEKRGMKEEVGNYAFGGETNPKHETLSAMENNPTAGFADGGDVSAVLAQLAQMPTSPSSFDVSGGVSTTPAVNLPPQIGGPSLAMPSAANNYSFLQPSQSPTPAPTPAMPPTPPPTPTPIPQPQTPSIGQVSQQLNSTPPTDYNFYKDISAEDRAKLYQQLTERQKSPGSMIASGLGGLGDAIARSYGGQNTNYQKDIMANQEAQKQGAVGAMDTQRQQKMQDLQGQMAMQKADPKSPVSQGYRQMFKQITGKQPGSNMSAAMIESTFPEYAKIIDAQLTAGASRMGHEVEAAKNIEGAGMFQGLRNLFNPAEAQAQTRLEELAGSKPPAGPSQAGWGMKRVK